MADMESGAFVMKFGKRAFLLAALGVAGCGIGVSTLSTKLTATANPAVDIGQMGRKVAIVAIDQPSQGLFGLSGPSADLDALYRQALTTELLHRGYRVVADAAQADLFARLKVTENRMEHSYWTGVYALDLFYYPPGAQGENGVSAFSSYISVGYVPSSCVTTPRVATRSIGMLFETFPHSGAREQTVDLQPGC